MNIVYLIYSIMNEYQEEVCSLTVEDLPIEKQEIIKD